MPANERIASTRATGDTLGWQSALHKVPTLDLQETVVGVCVSAFAAYSQPRMVLMIVLSEC